MAFLLGVPALDETRASEDFTSVSLRVGAPRKAKDQDNSACKCALKQSAAVVWCKHRYQSAEQP